MHFNLPEIKIFSQSAFNDYRGSLWTVWDNELTDLKFNHDKVSVSKKNVLRGLHCDKKSWKFITCLHGRFQLVVVDFRKESSNYLKYQSIILSGDNPKSILIPPMFANGHLVLSNEAVFFYKWSYEGDYPDVNDQYSLNWRDPELGIDWYYDNPILSERDKNSKFISYKGE